MIREHDGMMNRNPSDNDASNNLAALHLFGEESASSGSISYDDVELGRHHADGSGLNSILYDS